MIFTAHADGWLDIGARRARCALGAAGVVTAAEKREGDGATPAGTWPLRGLLYRPDRVPPPATSLSCRVLQRDDGWCDDVADSHYNRAVTLPYAARAEALWREDGLYDLVVILGFNDAPVVAGCGSAIFLHLATADYAPTRGCVATSLADLAALIMLAGPGDGLEIRGEPA